MQPQNPNQHKSPFPNQPQQPGQAPFHRRSVQPIAPRPFASPQPVAPSPAPQQIQVSQPAQQPVAQPQQVRPQPVQPVAPPAPKPSMGEFVSAPRPAQPVQPQFRQPSQPIAPAAPSPAQSFNTSPSSRPQAQPVRPEEPLDLDLSHDTFPRPGAMAETQAKSGLPKGAFALIGIGVIGLAVGLVDKSQHSMLFNVVLALDVLLAAALFLRKDAIRKATMGLAIATVTASAALTLGYRGLIDNTVNAEALFIAEAKKLQNQSPTKQLTHEQQQHLDAMQLQLEAQQNAIGENSALVYGKYGVTAALYALIAFYLTRPKVKEAFERAIK